MTDITIEILSNKINISINLLIKKLLESGIKKKPKDLISQIEIKNFLKYLYNLYKSKLNKFVIQKKMYSTLNTTPNTFGKSKFIKIEIRKKKTYIEHNNKISKEEKIFNALKIYQKNSLKKHLNKKNISKFSLEENIINNNIKKIKEIKLIKNNKNNISNLENIKNTNKIIEIQKKLKKSKHIKIEKKYKKNIKEIKKITKKNKEKWKSLINTDEDINNYHITTSIHAQIAEDENDLKAETEIIKKIKIKKNQRNKKNNRLMELKSNKLYSKNFKKNTFEKIKKSNIIHSFNKPKNNLNKDIIIGETITVSELCNKMAKKSSEVIKKMMNLGSIITINQTLDQETAQLLAEEMGHKVIINRKNDIEDLILNDRNNKNKKILIKRAPIITIMGHVNHGKTSLIDFIRSSKIALGEKGKITQHIGAYYVTTNNGCMTFLDTPGHSAFTAMRARGAKITDIVILVVASDDGVMPQTIEAIHHAKEANVPIIVAINKIDKITSNPKYITKQLIENGIIPEKLGGDSQFIKISSKTGKGINTLLDAITLQSEIINLKVIKNTMAIGIIIESFLDKGRGPVSTIIIQEGTLKKGDIILCGIVYGKIRSIRNQIGKELNKIGPSIPVEIIGLSGIPLSGDKAIVVKSDKKAREASLYRKRKFKEIKLENQQKNKLDDIFSKIKEKKLNSELKIILKSDVKGSSEAIRDSLNSLSTNKVKINIIGFGVGNINENDVTLALASNAIILGFNVCADHLSKKLIKSENVNVQYYSVIFDLLKEVEKIIKGYNTIEYKQKIIGLAEVRNIFKSPKYGLIAGCIVKSGYVKRNFKIQILRNNLIIYKGEIESLRRFKENVIEVKKGIECGIGIKNFNDIISGDIIEVINNNKK
ncbi:translation initiation factor IF-2 [Sodalis-like secondary symbiont of Drepanosiphum platanoidis]|uniref:translation initiation factor IF-2 n=1 Tax=Sodalis-like secondary symbiont of Drepanosiphum platanoidis TaxID=2994493 RepID=UPI003464E47C